MSNGVLYRDELYVEGRKDNKKRRVEHIPRDRKTRKSSVSTSHSLVRLESYPGNWVNTIIRNDRIRHRKVSVYGELLN